LSAIDLTAKAIFDRLMLVPGWGKTGKFCHNALYDHILNAHWPDISRFPCNLSARFGNVVEASRLVKVNFGINLKKKDTLCLACFDSGWSGQFA